MDSYLDAESPTPFLWDELWGGIVHCGCNFEEDVCTNEYPNCPGLEDPGSNFGFSFFNDQHFHLGYFIHAAAVLTRNDPVWGRENFDKILVLIRNIANVSGDDEYFPKYRHKDVYLGSSWASGIALLGEGPYPNGRNQESSSEAIAAYEGIALYGEASYHLFGAGKGSSTADNDKAETSRAVRDTGRFLMTTEVRSAIQVSEPCDRKVAEKAKFLKTNLSQPRFARRSTGTLETQTAKFTPKITRSRLLGCCGVRWLSTRRGLDLPHIRWSASSFYPSLLSPKFATATSSGSGTALLRNSTARA